MFVLSFCVRVKCETRAEKNYGSQEKDERMSKRQRVKKSKVHCMHIVTEYSAWIHTVWPNSESEKSKRKEKICEKKCQLTSTEAHFLSCLLEQLFAGRGHSANVGNTQCNSIAFICTTHFLVMERKSDTFFVCSFSSLFLFLDGTLVCSRLILCPANISTFLKNVNILIVPYCETR